MESGIRKAIVGWEDFRNWPLSTFAAAHHFGSDERNNGHAAEIANRSKVTHLRSGGCIAAVETMSILAAGEEPSPAT
jgi:hypothetical protein